MDITTKKTRTHGIWKPWHIITTTLKAKSRRTPTIPMAPCISKSAYSSAHARMPMTGGCTSVRRRGDGSTGNGCQSIVCTFARTHSIGFSGNIPSRRYYCDNSLLDLRKSIVQTSCQSRKSWCEPLSPSAAHRSTTKSGGMCKILDG
jgi:hypothetical protein